MSDTAPNLAPTVILGCREWVGREHGRRVVLRLCLYQGQS